MFFCVWGFAVIMVIYENSLWITATQTATDAIWDIHTHTQPWAKITGCSVNRVWTSPCSPRTEAELQNSIKTSQQDSNSLPIACLLCYWRCLEILFVLLYWINSFSRTVRVWQVHLPCFEWWHVVHLFAKMPAVLEKMPGKVNVCVCV